MTEPDHLLPSWRPGATRDTLIKFLEDAAKLPRSERVACFDNDGTLWCEKPTYIQFDFFVDALKRRLAIDPSLAERPEFAALIGGDERALGELGLVRIALALVSLFHGQTPKEFDAAARDFMASAEHSTLDRPLRAVVYQPMLELLDELRRREFTIFIVTGGGTEFVRAISVDLYDIAPEAVVGTLIAYEFSRGDDDTPQLRRTSTALGEPDEGTAKVKNIQTQLGRQPILAAGNTTGDREMLEWARAGDGPRLALLVDHDDGIREFEYAGAAVTVAEDEPITDVARRLGWSIISMANDWEQIFPN